MATFIRKVSAFVAALILLISETRADYVQINMGDHWLKNCLETFFEAGGVISAYAEEFSLFLPIHYDCQITVQAPHPEQRFYIRFERLEVYSTYGDCFDHRLDIFDGPDRSAPKMSGIQGFCTEYQKKHVLPEPMLTTTDSVTVYIYRTERVLRPGAFRIIFAAFKNSYDGKCFKCENHTSLCMDESLKCDSINHCSDASDESYNGKGGCADMGLYKDMTTYGIVITSVVIVLIVMTITIVIVAAIFFYRRRHGTPPKQPIYTGDVVTRRAPPADSNRARGAYSAPPPAVYRDASQFEHQQGTPAGYTPGEGVTSYTSSSDSEDSDEKVYQ